MYTEASCRGSVADVPYAAQAVAVCALSTQALRALSLQALRCALCMISLHIEDMRAKQTLPLLLLLLYVSMDVCDPSCKCENDRSSYA